MSIVLGFVPSRQRRSSAASQGQGTRRPLSRRPLTRLDALPEEASPFGLQGLLRDELQLLKSEAIGPLAAILAVRGSRREIRDPAFVARILSRHPEWIDEYRVVHLIEKSLWIQGRSDLVMTMTRNPSQIPDNPPPAIVNALTEAYDAHPEGTVWFGVPLFRDETNAEGLPLPMTADEVRAESQRRIAAAQKMALRWRAFYRVAGLATAAVHGVQTAVERTRQRIRQVSQAVAANYRRARRDARKRTRAAVKAQREYCQYGESFTKVPEHRTTLGRVAAGTLEAVLFAQELSSHVPSGLGAVTLPLLIAKIIPLAMTPVVVVSCDPFLFIELPEEPGKLRHLGHWYWQDQASGKKKLHLHPR